MKTRKTEPPKTTPLVDKLLAKKGPAVFTQAELQQLQAAFIDITQDNLQLTQIVHGIGEALQRHNLKVNHIEHDDGSVGFDLENATNDENVTVN